jgi:hypothetical protein
MKRIDGVYYRRFKGPMGRKYLVEMSQREVMEVYAFRASVVMLPLAFIFSAAALIGMI